MGKASYNISTTFTHHLPHQNTHHKMPRIPKTLTSIEIKNLEAGTVNVGGVKGLYFRRTKSQAFFFLRYVDAFGRHDYSLGNYPRVGLAAARKLALEAWDLLDRGIDPIEERKRLTQTKREAALAAHQEALKKIQTFEKVANEWIADRVCNNYWARNIRGEQTTRRILEKYVYPHIGKKNIEDITPEEIRDMLQPIWQSVPSTARKAKSYTNKIFSWAIAMHKRENRENPAVWNGPLSVLMEPLQTNRKAKQNHAACAVNEIPRLFAETSQYQSITARAVEFAILTCARSQAVRLATWDEFDLDKGVWTIPLEHDKVKTANRDRTVFLSEAAQSLLSRLPRLSGTKFVFPSSQGGHLSDTALTMFLRGLHEKRLAQDGIGWVDKQKSKLVGKPCVITIHGTARATFRTWAKDDELGNLRKFSQEAVELCLLHSKNDAYEGAYDRAPLAKERRFIMESWGEYCMQDLTA